MKRQKTRFGRLWTLAIWGAVLFGTTSAGADSPQGVMKQAIHWGLSGDWLDPGTNPGVTTSAITLYLFQEGEGEKDSVLTTSLLWF